jgi:ribosomal-protein-alanine N-acetyltransferase
MQFRFRPMTAADARAVERWRYPAPYDVYDRRSARSLDPASDPGRYFAAENREGLAGFFEFERAEEGRLHFDLSLRPELTGEGHGESFVRAGLEFAAERWSPDSFEVTVDSFNDRALTVYDRLGFDRAAERAVSDGGAASAESAEHVTMRREEPLE